MAGSSDKARFFLEQSVPELKEYERKKIFSPEEIAAIAKKRSEFEHKLNARGSQPGDYARYAEFEINVDTLRRKRVKRLGIRNLGHSAKRNIFSILRRGTRKFPGDIGLCMQEIEFARSQRAYKKLSQIITKALRLHPTKPDLWSYAAQLAMDEQGDIGEARSCMQRGLRFCKNSKSLWLTYLRLELLYLAKINARHRVLGVESSSETNDVPLSLNDGKGEAPDAERQDNEVNVNNSGTATRGLQRLNSDKTPAKFTAFDGSVPIAIANAAVVQFGHDEELCQQLFEMAYDADFGPSKRRILEHLVGHIKDSSPKSWRVIVCEMRLSCLGVSPHSPTFPASFGASLKILQSATSEIKGRLPLIEAVETWLGTFLDDADLDPALRQIMVSTTYRLRNVDRQIA